MVVSIDPIEALLAAPLASFDTLMADPKLVPGEPGVYGWWFRRAPRLLPTEGAFERGDLRLLYVGIAPQRASTIEKPTRRTLRRRLRDHVRGRVARSTLRRSLACLLAEDLGLRFGSTSSGKLMLLEDGEARLSAWMASNARVAWLGTPKPWVVENAVLARGPRLPLNIKGSTDPFRTELRRIRRMESL